MSPFEVRARLKVRDGQLEGFKRQSRGDDAPDQGEGHRNPRL
jgi:hypothetical protein